MGRGRLGRAADFDAAVGQFPNVYLYSLDDLEPVCEQNRQQRAREMPLAARIVDEEVEQGSKFVERERIHDRALVAHGDLDEAQLGPVRLLAHELGVDGDATERTRPIAERGKAVGVVEIDRTLSVGRLAAVKVGTPPG